MLYMEEIYNSATATYTDDPVLLIAYALFCDSGILWDKRNDYVKKDRG